MKNRHFLYNLMKAGIVTTIITIMLCTAVQKTSALDTDSEDTISTTVEENVEIGMTDMSEEETDIPTESMTPDETKVEKDTTIPETTTPADSTDSEAVDSSDLPAGVAEENTDNSVQTPDAPQSPDTPQETDTPQTSDISQETDTPQSPDAPQETDTPLTPDTPQETDTPQSPDVPQETDTPQTPDTSKAPDESQTPSSSSETNTSPQAEVATSPKASIQDKSSGAIYIRPNYNPSEAFIDLEDRIKYNAALPIDNIPSFITQEMIIGALKCQDETGFPASVTIAQIIQESGFGKYGPGGDERQGLSYLAYQYCNLFGIKGTGTAGTVNMLTGEQKASGEFYSTTAGFRVYNTYTECIEDRTSLLQRVYGDLIRGANDANTFAMRIGSRWATSLSYSQHLIELMERYDLYRLDRMTLLDFSNMIGRFAEPCPGSYLTSAFGYRDFDKKFHKGIDLGTNGAEIPVYAAESGTIIRAEYDSLAGNWIMIDHGNGLVTKYMHFSHTFVQKGQQVTKGQQIGLTGTTGNSTGIHLHFQVEENGVAVDPTPYLNTIEK